MQVAPLPRLSKERDSTLTGLSGFLARAETQGSGRNDGFGAVGRLQSLQDRRDMNFHRNTWLPDGKTPSYQDWQSVGSRS